MNRLSLRSFLPLLLLTACGLSEQAFQDAFPVDLCAYAEECVTSEAEEDGDPLEATCEEGLLAAVTALQNDDTCTYDAAQGQLCLDGIAEASCDDTGASTVAATCSNVYTGDACNLTLVDFL